jgi:hypothetical protein
MESKINNYRRKSRSNSKSKSKSRSNSRRRSNSKSKSKSKSIKNKSSEDRIFYQKNIEKLKGSEWWKLIQLIYLSRIYKNICIFLPMEEIEKNLPFTKESYIELTTKNTYAFSLLWINKIEDIFILYEPAYFNNMEEYIKYLKNCIKKSDRMTIIPLTLFSIPHKSAHSNILIYDKKLNTLERYDSLGSSPQRFDIYNLDNELTIFSQKINKDCEYIKPENLHINKGVQTIEGEIGKELNKIKLGSCSIWSFLYTILRLKNPDIPPKKLTELLNNSIHKREKSIWHFILETIIIIYKLSEKIRYSQNIDEINQYIDNMNHLNFVVL